MTWETRDPDLSSLLYLRLYECWLTHEVGFGPRPPASAV